MKKWDAKLIERFESKYTKVVSSGCWVWVGAVRGHYGVFRNGKSLISSHRIAFLMHKGEIPNGLLVCHRCDVKLCVNPDHLFLGTHKDNSQDAWVKGRYKMPAVTNRSTNLQTAVKIREMKSLSITGRKISEILGIKYHTVKRILRGDTYKG